MDHIWVEVDENSNALEWADLVASYFHLLPMLVPYCPLLVTAEGYVKIDKPRMYEIPYVSGAHRSTNRSSKVSRQSHIGTTCLKLQDPNQREENDEADSVGGGAFPSPTGAVDISV